LETFQAGREGHAAAGLWSLGRFGEADTPSPKGDKSGVPLKKTVPLPDHPTTTHPTPPSL